MCRLLASTSTMRCSTPRAVSEVECFDCRDVVAAGLPLQAGDLVVGLHPCGALGEAIVRVSATVRAVRVSREEVAMVEAAALANGAVLLAQARIVRRRA